VGGPLSSAKFEAFEPGAQSSWRVAAKRGDQQIVVRKDRFARIGLLLAAVLVSTAGAAPRASQVNFGAQGAEREFRDAVEIGNDIGGFVADYALRLYELREERRKVRFVGVCDSACMLFLALPAEQTCIAEGAYFRFHAPSAPSASAAAAVGAYMMRKYPPWVRYWIVAPGGLSDRLATMSYRYAQNFMRPCNSMQR
jgi:hypothetical protein